MTASIINFQLIVVAQIWIYPPFPLMIYPARIKEPVTSQIRFQLPALLPLKNLFVLWPTLLILHGSFSYLLMILTININWRNTSLTTAGLQEDTALGNMMKKRRHKRHGSITPRAMIKTRNLTTVMGFLGLIPRWGLAPWNINIVWNKDSVGFCVYLPSILYFTCCTHFCACFLPVPLITPCSNPYVWSAWNVDCLNACDDSPVR